MVTLPVVILSLLAVSALSVPQWGPCPFNSTKNAVCSRVPVPLDWFSPVLGNITNFVSKIPALGSRKGTVWFLNGGSGVGGRCLAEGVPSWITYYNSLGFDVIAPDFRGAGQSVPKIDCPDNIYNTPSLACAQFLQDSFGPKGMYFYSLTQGSYDLNYLLTTLGGPGPHYIQGDSFGTFWGQKYATIFPEQADAYVFESFISMSRWMYFEAPQLVDWVGRMILNYCGLDPVCAGRVTDGLDVVTAVERLLEDVRMGTLTCISKLPSYMAPTGDWHTTFQQMFGGLLGPSRGQAPLVPAFVYRVQRCSAQDVGVITHFWNVTHPTAQQEQPLADPCDISNVVLYNAFLQEGIPQIPPPSYEQLLQTSQSAIFTPNMIDFQHSRQLYDAWPIYTPDQYYHKVPQTTKPILLVNGDLDFSTPYPQAAQAFLEYQKFNPLTPITFVHLPACPHVGFLDSMTSSGIPCGITVITQFFLNGGLLPDSSCTQDILPIDWTFEKPATQLLSTQFFGTPDAWGYVQ